MVTGQGRERHNVNCFKTGGAVLYSTLGVSTVSFTEAKSAAFLGQIEKVSCTEESSND